VKSAREWIDSKTHLASKNVVTDRFEVADILAIQTDARADLLSRLQNVIIDATDLTERLRKAEAQLREADWIINAQRDQHSQAVDLEQRRDKWIEERKTNQPKGT
jgi:hypothetical protein